MTRSHVDVRIGVDLRVETVMAALAVAMPRLPLAGWVDHPIRRRLRRRSAALAAHDAPRLLRRLLSGPFWIDDVLRLALAFVDERAGVLVPRDSAVASDRPGVLAGCDRLAHALVDFSDRADIRECVGDATEIRADVEHSVGGVPGVESIVARARAELGAGPSRVRIAPSPLSNAHLGYGPTVGAEDAAESWVIFGPVWRPERRVWQLVGFRSPKVLRIVRHEIGHSHLNVHTERVRALVDRHQHLFERMEPAMTRLGYGRWDVCLNEHILRALDLRVLREEAGARAAARQKAREQARGFTLIGPVLEALDGIAGTPLADAFPEFLEHFTVMVTRRHGHRASPAAVSAAV